MGFPSLPQVGCPTWRRPLSRIVIRQLVQLAHRLLAQRSVSLNLSFHSNQQIFGANRVLQQPFSRVTLMMGMGRLLPACMAVMLPAKMMPLMTRDSSSSLDSRRTHGATLNRARHSEGGSSPARAGLMLSVSRRLKLFTRAGWFPVLWCVCMASTSLAASLPNYIKRVWTTDDGLPGSTVMTIIQSHDGYLWLGTRSGLARFERCAIHNF